MKIMRGNNVIFENKTAYLITLYCVDVLFSYQKTSLISLTGLLCLSWEATGLLQVGIFIQEQRRQHNRQPICLPIGHIQTVSWVGF